ncbi:MAG TPA: GNAT family N-acetyltransferase [Streptosporangiaceae bacterium]|nr:GNAT family N-acetyltransferase [Streptosporangiaceae bacterium]
MAQTSGGARTVRPLARADLNAAVATLTRAFDDDPVMRWIFPDDRMRQRRLPLFFASALRSTGLHSDGTEVAIAGGQVQGCAIWMAPGTWRPPLWRQLAAAPSVLYRLRSRLAVASVTFGALQRAHPQRPHWYLSGIGTDPPAQGSGVGSELMRSRLVRCDAAGEPAYLESSKESNVPFYQRHGFRVTGELTVPGGGPTFWLMWREPQLASAQAG